ncbi:MAG: response regulator, partial [Desulfovibrio sp.]|nr:response regulator [Desulfovibrio sp.]
MSMEKEYAENPDKDPNAVSKLKRHLARKERDLEILSGLYEQAEQLRRTFAKEKKIQLLYNNLLLKHSPNLAFIFDEELRFVLGSHTSGALTSDAPNNLLQKPFSQVFSEKMDPGWVEKIRRQCLEALSERKTFRYDDTIDLGIGKLSDVQVALGPVVDEDSVCHGVILTLSDVSELADAKRRAEDGAKSKSIFLANMSHEIRTPMNAIKGFSEILIRSELNDLQRSYVNNIIGATSSLINIINDVLDFSKIDAGKIEIVERPYRLAKMLTEVCNIISIRAEEKGLLFLVNADPGMPSGLIGDDSRIKQILVNLLSNAVKYTPQGSVHFSLNTETRDGRLFLIASVKDSGIGIQAKDIPFLFDAFSRADLQANRNIMGTGLGLAISKQLAVTMGGEISVISEHGLGSVFSLEIPQETDDGRPMCQLDDPGRFRVLLVGNTERLGNVENMLAALGACHWLTVGENFEDEENLADRLAANISGKPFTHCLRTGDVPENVVSLLRGKLAGCRMGLLQSLKTPVEESAQRLHEDILFDPLLITDLVEFISHGTQDEQRQDQDMEGEAFKVHDVSALVVDDNEINLIIGKELLESFGVEVVCVDSGPKALALCEERQYDIIFLDHMMPIMDGVEVAQRIRAGASPNQKTPLIAFTANVVNNMQAFYMENGMNDFVPKPIDYAELQRVLALWLP